MLKIFFLFSLILLSLRRFFVEKGVPGHNWDWSFPQPDFLFNNLSLPTRFAWWRMELGMSSNLNISHLIPDTLLVLTAQITGPKWSIVILLALLLFFSFIFFNRMMNQIIGKSDYNFSASLLYAFSPFLFNDIIGGSWYMWISFAFAPLFFSQLILFIENKKKRNLLVFLFASVFTASSLQQFLLLEIILLTYLIFRAFKGKLAIKSVLFHYLVAHFFLIVFSLYWLLPFIYTLPDYRETFAISSFSSDFSSVRYSWQNVWSIFSLVGYFTRNMYYYALPEFLFPFFLLSVFVCWGVIFWSIYKSGQKRDLYFWSTLLVIFILLIKGGNFPLSNLAVFLYERIFLLRLFRSPQHLMFAAAFIIPIILSLSFAFFSPKRVENKRKMQTAFLLFILIWISGWWYNGDLGHERLLSLKKDYLSFYTLSGGLLEAYKRSQNEERDSRVFFLPSAFSVNFIENEFQSPGQGGVAEYMYLKNPTFSSSYNLFANEIDLSFFQNNENPKIVDFLSFFSVKHIVVREDVKPSFTSTKNYWNLKKVRQVLDGQGSLQKVSEGDGITVYEVGEDKFLPHFFVPEEERVCYGSDEVKALSGVVNFEEERVCHGSNSVKALLGVVNFEGYKLRSALYPLDRNKTIPFENPEKQILVIPTVDEIARSETENLEDVEYEYKTVRHKPGSLSWQAILLKELYQEIRSRGDKLGRIKLEIKFANKRIVELDKYGILGAVGWQTKIYREKVKKAISLVEQLDQEKHRILFRRRIKNNLLYNLQTVREIDNGSGLLGGWEQEILKSLDEVEKLKIRDMEAKPGVIYYKFKVPKRDEYSLYISESSLPTTDPQTIDSWTFFLDGEKILREEKVDKEGDLIVLSRLDLDKDREYVLSINFSEVNPLEVKKERPDLYATTEWVTDTWYYVTGNARLTTGNVSMIFREVFEDESGKEIMKVARQSVISLTNTPFGFYVKATPLAKRGELYLEPLDKSDEEYEGSEIQELQIFPLYQPKLLLRTELENLKTEIPKMTFKRISPVKYRLKIEEVKAPYTLVFNEGFNRGWKLYRLMPSTGGEFDKITASHFEGYVREGVHQDAFWERGMFETWGKSPVADNRHFVVNGYANAWQILPEEMGRDGEYELVVEFLPQRWVYFGLLLMFLTTIILGLMTLREYVSAKRK